MSLTLGRLGVVAGSFPIAGGDFESIATVTVGSGGAADIEFTSIPSTYQHLQLRAVGRYANAGGTYTDGVSMRFNGVSTTTYASHEVYSISNSSAVIAGGAASQNRANFANFPQGGEAASRFGVWIADILDYSSSSKAKTIRSLTGYDANTGPTSLIAPRSALWTSTNAITSLRLFGQNGHNFAQHTTVALYGVKAP
jgi:hypothetical protein